MADEPEKQGGDPVRLTPPETKETPEPRTFTEDEVKAERKLHGDEKAAFGRTIAEKTKDGEATKAQLAILSKRLEEIPALQEKLDTLEDKQADGEPETLDVIKLRRETRTEKRRVDEDKRTLDENWLQQASEIQEARVLKSQIKALKLAEEHGVDATELYTLGGGAELTPASTELMEKLAPSLKPIKPEPVTVADSGGTAGSSPSVPDSAMGKIRQGWENQKK